jgi:hypothetical protein
MLSDKGKGPGGYSSAAIPRSGIWGYDRISRLIGSFADGERYQMSFGSCKYIRATKAKLEITGACDP